MTTKTTGSKLTQSVRRAKTANTEESTSVNTETVATKAPEKKPAAKKASTTRSARAKKSTPNKAPVSKPAREKTESTENQRTVLTRRVWPD